MKLRVYFFLASTNFPVWSGVGWVNAGFILDSIHHTIHFGPFDALTLFHCLENDMRSMQMGSSAPFRLFFSHPERTDFLQPFPTCGPLNMYVQCFVYLPIFQLLWVVVCTSSLYSHCHSRMSMRPS
jgi:hypothetical protein